MNDVELFRSKASQVKNLKHFIICAVTLLGYFFYQDVILQGISSVIKDFSHFVTLPRIDIKQWVIYALLVYPAYTFWRVLVVYNEEYVFSTDRLIINSGVLNKKSDYLEYFRIKDYTITRSIIERLTFLCSITIVSTDRTNPFLTLSYIKNFISKEPEFRHAIDESTASGKGREVDIV